MNAIKIFMALMLVLIVGFFAVGFTSTVTAPDINTTAGQQYNNMSKVTDIASVGINATALILIGAMVIAALIFMIKIARKR